MKVKNTVAILIASLCLMACGADSAESLPRELTAKEIEDYNTYLKGWDCYGFLLSSYDDVRNVNLDQVFYSGAGLSEQPQEEEVEAYLQEIGEKEVFTDLFYIPAAKVDELLLEKTGYSLQDMQDVGNDLHMVYLEAYDAYFTEAGDTNYMSITCTSGTENADGTVTLECESSMEDGEDYTIIHRCTVTLDKDTRQFIRNDITEGYFAN
jgi:hypothetical protein